MITSADSCLVFSSCGSCVSWFILRSFCFDSSWNENRTTKHTNHTKKTRNKKLGKKSPRAYLKMRGALVSRKDRFDRSLEGCELGQPSWCDKERGNRGEVPEMVFGSGLWSLVLGFGFRL